MKKPNQFGKYYLFDRINVGGMAEIYRAKTFGLEGSERLVVVKKMIPLIADDRELVSMFIDEAKLVVQLNHPNIGQVSDWGKVDESYYIAMEYIAGRDLRSAAQRCKQQVIDGSPTMPLAQGCFIVMKLCEALDYAHNKKDSLGKDLGLVHRDVSPANVMISYEGEVKLIDFGVAKIESARRQETEAGVLKGKFGYLSPEQVRGEKLDRRSDIFSTGIVLYELLTAERLFPPDNDLAVLDRIKNVEVLPPTAYNRKIPEELERIVMKALAPAVADRYQTAMDLHADLQAFLYTSGEFFSRKELAAWMKRVFRAEQEQEQQELDAVREFRAAAPASGSANEPLARARATMSMAALRVPEPSAARVPGKETGALLAIGPKQTGSVRALGGDSAAPSSWTPSNVKTRKHASKPPPTPRPSVGSIAEAASSMARPADPPRPPPPSRSGSAIPKLVPPRAAPMTRAAEIEEDTAVDGPLGGGRLRDPRSDSGNNRAFMAAGQAAYEGETRAFAPTTLSSGPDPGDAETRAFGQFSADLAEGGPTIAVPPSHRTPATAAPVEPPVARAAVPVVAPRPMEPPMAVPASAPVQAEPLQSRSVPVVAPPQLAVPQTVDLGPPEQAAAPKQRSAAPLVLLLLLLVCGALGGAYWFLLRPGELIVVTEPGRELTVLVDSQPVPFTESPVRLQLKPGGHNVRIEHSGHTPWSEGINIAAGETIIRNIRMDSATPKTGGFTLVSEPAGAAASLDGSSLGQVTPMRVQSVLAGPHTLELRLGNRMWRQQITVEPGKLLEVKATLPPEDQAGTNKPASTATPGAENPPEKPVATAPAPPEKPAPPVSPPPAVNPPVENKTKPVADNPRPEPKRTPPKPRPPKLALPKAPVPVATGNFGYLRVNSKPWTKIIVDGVDTGLNTPQTSYRLTPGTHKLTLFNPQFNIKETFTITLNAGETQTVIKDFLK